MSSDEALGRRTWDTADTQEPVTVTDKRRIDPDTGEVREQATGPAPSEPAPEAGGSPQEVTELKSTLQRVKAEYDNYRKRTLRDQQVIAERSKATVLTELLPVLDDLDRARSHGDLESGPFKAVADKLTGILEGLGLSGFGDEGDDFDPELHEAVQHDGDGSHPVVGTVMRRGYRVGDFVLRHAMVGVVDTVPDPADSPDNTDESDEKAAES